MLKALRAASAGVGLTAALLEKAGTVLGGMEWDLRGRRALSLAG